ncbi:MAG: transaldolase [Candidatus Dormiibacterota bacterium]
MTVPSLSQLRVEVFADGADRAGIELVARNPLIRGFTTNPTLMRASGVVDYEAFAHDVLTLAGDRPVSFEVFADDFDNMIRQGRRIARWGGQVFVKIPVTDSHGVSTSDVVGTLSSEGIQLNVTAMTTPEQVERVVGWLHPGSRHFVSLFAGRIADTGRDPVPLVRRCVEILAARPEVRLIWASPREILNVVQANQAGCHVITVTHDLLKKLSFLGKDLDQLSLETVRMFHRDAVSAGYVL